MQQEIGRRANELLSNRAIKEWSEHTGANIWKVDIGKVHIRYSSGVMTVYLELYSGSSVEIYREIAGIPEPQLVELRERMVLDDLADV